MAFLRHKSICNCLFCLTSVRREHFCYVRFCKLSTLPTFPVSCTTYAPESLNHSVSLPCPHTHFQGQYNFRAWRWGETSKGAWGGLASEESRKPSREVHLKKCNAAHREDSFSIKVKSCQQALNKQTKTPTNERLDPKTEVLGDFDRISCCGRMTKNGKKLETVRTFNSVK